MWTLNISKRWRESPALLRGCSLLCVGLLLLLVGSALLSGCAGQASVIRALGANTNSVTVKVTTPWGTLDYQRDK